DNSVSTTASLIPTGNLELTLFTVDGGQIPTGTEVCVETICESADVLAAAIDSGTVLTIAGFDPGTYYLTVQNAAPYLDASGIVTFSAGLTATAAITLALPDPTATATATATPTATSTATATATSTVTPSPTSTTAAQPTRELPANIPTRSATATPT